MFVKTNFAVILTSHSLHNVKELPWVAIEEGAVAAGSEGGEDEDAPTAALLGPPEEAIEDNEDEADDGDDPFGHKKRKRRKETDQQMANIVDDKIAKMEAAAEADMEEHQNRRPAIHKLKVLAEVEEFLAQKKYHELFISSGGLGVLKAWVEPYADGSLPNARVRAAVLRGCQLLPIDTTREDMKAQLKRSELGKRVLFLSMCSAETMENKRMARELVQNWSRPIYDDPDAEAEKKRIRSKQLEKARLANVAMQRAAEAKKAAQRPALRPGDPGWRMHASIPQATKLDYVHEPSVSERVQQASAAAAAAAAHAPEKSSRFAKKMREVLRKQKSTAARAAKPSVEGRTITLLN
ncbi:hypothetical protein CEUSTIGMA_g13401.t1 [Chlamydomonas eustigma]|uniref:TFIIS N-terminal domain-containing protein n=1 Tax=Chlamydomonas eustigma TaxID=1157962 RepID=A0A250XSF1_9CHLO|nr:hypothetical protein CEUSTIGMA_g13401.t1 [Chlamydomonas eustigma]|eukprot:GAX85985.1 hypothetical protein CEUSTIGMA_g13401.t1 [Chlamydomonas eustigma]